MFKDTAIQQCEELMNMTTLWNLTECHLLHLLLSEIVGHCSNRRSTHQLYRSFFWPKAIWTYQATNLSFHFADISRRNAPQRKGLTMARNAKAAASMSQMDKMGSMAKYTLTLTRRWSKDNIEKKNNYSTQTWTWMTWTYILFNIFQSCWSMFSFGQVGHQYSPRNAEHSWSNRSFRGHEHSSAIHTSETSRIVSGKYFSLAA